MKENRLKMTALHAMALELKVIACVLEVDNILGRSSPELWQEFEKKRREVEFWKLVLVEPSVIR